MKWREEFINQNRYTDLFTNNRTVGVGEIGECALFLLDTQAQFSTSLSSNMHL